MTHIIKSIHDFNSRAGLLTGYNDNLECSMYIEESLEGLSNLHTLAGILSTSDASPKNLSRMITAIAHNGLSITDVERLDKACDLVFEAIGSMAKLGLSVNQIERSILAVISTNHEKLGMPRDSHGKLMKPDNFVGPEPLLQQILDEV